MVKLLIYDSCMIVKKETIISIYHDIQVVHKKHDGMIVVFLKSIIVLTNLNHKCRFIRYFSLERIVTDKVLIRSKSTDRFPAIQFCFQHTKFTAGLPGNRSVFLGTADQVWQNIPHFCIRYIFGYVITFMSQVERNIVTHT